MLLLNINRTSKIPVYRQIIEGVVGLIENGTLDVGDRLPSTRQLADKLGLNRTTTYIAFQELISLGYLESQPGSYTTVRERIKIAKDRQKARRGIISWQNLSNPSSHHLYETFESCSPGPETISTGDVINLSLMDPDHRLFPVADLKRCLNSVLSNEGSKLLSYGSYAGYRPLRECIAKRLQIHGITTEASEILLTNGAQQALELLIKLLTVPGSKVAIESPTYSNIIPLLKFYQIDAVEIPMLSDGMDLQRLKEQLDKHQFAFVYTIPNFHNPTGVTSSHTHREELLHLCEEHAVPIVEDGFEEEMKYFGKVSLPVKSMDCNQIVVYLGTFSKVLFPGIRVGWITAEKECIDRLTAIKRYSEITSNTVIQAAMEQFFRLGHYDRHIKKMHRIFRKRMRVTLDLLKEHMPDSIKWNQPEGGYTIWLELPRPYSDAMDLWQALKNDGVLASPGEFFFHSSNCKNYIRLSIASLNEEEIEVGILRLGKALRSI